MPGMQMPRQQQLSPTPTQQHQMDQMPGMKMQKINRLLGLWGADADWQLAGELPAVPSSEVPMRSLERLAISQRLDLQVDYLHLTSEAKNLGLTKAFRLLGALDFGIESERETDSQTRTGPTFAIELPIFNQGQARIARGEAVSEAVTGQI
jgi:outer membrane protein, heavy metal efflux system